MLKIFNRRWNKCWNGHQDTLRLISRVSQRPSKLSRACQRVKIKLTLIYLESIDEAFFVAVVIVVVEVVNVADVVVVVEVVKVVEVGAVVKAFFFGYHFLNLKRSSINECVRCMFWL